MPVVDATPTDRQRSVRLVDVAQDWRFAVIFLFVFSVLIRFIDIGRPPHVDELYHIMAARGWLTYGEPRIADGLYPRAELFTLLVAGSLKVFGDNLVAARLPSVIAGSLLVVAVFAWVRVVAGLTAAWATALLLCLSDLSFQLFLWARFYALHALVFWLGAIGTHTLVEARHGPRQKLALVVGVGVAWLLAVHLQPLTFFGLAGIATWWCVVIARSWQRSGRAGPRRGALILLGVALLATVIVVGFPGLLDSVWQYYRWAPPHSAEHQNEFWFYHLLLLERYQAIWPFFPFFALIALSEKPRPALFCFCIFTVVFVLASFAGQKDQRYLLFVIPFFFALCGMAFASFYRRLWGLLNGAAERAAAALLPRGMRRAAKWTALGMSLLFLVGANGSTAKTALMFVGVQLSTADGGVSLGAAYDGAAWSAASGPLEPWLERAEVVVTMGEEFTLYYIGDYDILIDRNRVVELGNREFTVDSRTGRPVVSKTESLELIMDCYQDGIIIVDTEIWRKPSRVGDELADLIEERMTRIDLPTTSRIVLFRWEQHDDKAPGACATMPQVAKKQAPVTQRRKSHPLQHMTVNSG